MKRLFITLFITIAAWQSANAMSYERAREEALYLTDKMAYELGLSADQYNAVYEPRLLPVVKQRKRFVRRLPVISSFRFSPYSL